MSEIKIVKFQNSFSFWKFFEGITKTSSFRFKKIFVVRGYLLPNINLSNRSSYHKMIFIISAELIKVSIISFIPNLN